MTDERKPRVIGDYKILFPMTDEEFCYQVGAITKEVFRSWRETMQKLNVTQAGTFCLMFHLDQTGFPDTVSWKCEVTEKEEEHGNTEP